MGLPPAPVLMFRDLKGMFTCRWGNPRRVTPCISDQSKDHTRSGGLPHLSGLPHLPGFPHLHVNRPRRRRQRECQNSNRFGSPKQQLHVHHAFLYIYLLSLHDYDGKMPNFTTAKFSFSFLTWIWFFIGIRLKKISLAFDKVNELELSR